ncbi:MAG: hypothetical protein J7K59_06060 [Candidatus Korarchaeota archaeon]|nr:hypothetical protein [Candidatus Korarchaeota archaeon]
MSSWIEEIVTRYYQINNFLVLRDYAFYLPREKTGKKVGGWSDIDILAYNVKELHIVQCRAFLGRQKSEKEVEDIVKWFELAEEAVRENLPNLCYGLQIQKILILSTLQPKKAIKIVEEKGIKVKDLHTVIKETLKILKKEIKEYREKGRVGYYSDPLLALMREMIIMKIIKI